MGGDTVEPITILQVGGPGMAMYQVHHFSDAERQEVLWMLRTTTAKISSLPADCPVELRAGSFLVNDVCLIPVLLCLDKTETEEGIFETWINVNQMGENPLTFLAIQPRIVIQLLGDSGQVEKILQISNPLKALSKTLLAELGSNCDWTLSKFEAARETSFKRFPSVVDLWKELPLCK